MNDLKKLEEGYFFSKEAAAIRGIPDIIGCYRGRFIALELKRSEKEARKKGRNVLQKYVIEKMNAAGGFARVMYPENYKEIMEEMLSL